MAELYGKVGLYPHNKNIYLKAKEAYEKGEKVVGVLEGTGLGKTNVALELIHDFKDLKTIYLVPNEAAKEHIEEIIAQNKNLDRKRDFPNLEIWTYQKLCKLSKKELKELKVDFLVTDELHHIGAPVWGNRVNTLVETHPNLKVLGMSAYSVRDRNTPYERDMVNSETDELFSGKVVARYDTVDAMIDGLVAPYIYKSACYILEKELKIYEKRATKRKINVEKLLQEARKKVPTIPTTKEILLKTLKKGDKCIYFCPVNSEKNLNDIDTIMEITRSWLKEIMSEDDFVLYKTISKDKALGKKNRDCFYNDLTLENKSAEGKLKIMFCINQYNEAVHAKGVNKIIMGRGTKSDIVFFEQIGRCSKVVLNEEELVSPTIIDLAGNIDFIKELQNELKNRIKEILKTNQKSHTKREIKIKNIDFDIEIFNQDLLDILTSLKERLSPKTWGDWYELAKEYREEHGNLLVPIDYKTELQENLGTWIGTQRIAYQNRLISKEKRTSRYTPLTDEQVEKLESIGMVWDVNGYLWDKMYELAKEYYLTHGNLLVPNRYKTPSGEPLGAWISRQRTAYQNGLLSKEKQEKLENIGMVWDVDKYQWNKMYELAKEYREEHGNLLVPFNYKTPSGEPLGTWIATQRTAYQNRLISKEKRTTRFTPLTDEQVAKLENIGMVWDVNGYLWDKMYELAKEYREEHSNLLVPQNYKTPSGEPLGRWIVNQRVAYQNGLITKEKQEKLENIGMVWDVNGYLWDKMYELAKEYYLTHGNLLVPNRYKTPSGEPLGTWISRQRIAYQNRLISKDKRTTKYTPLTDEQVKKLESIGMVWDVNGYFWDKMYKLAMEYYLTYGNLLIPVDYKTSSGEALGNWIVTQRTAYQNRLTSKEKRTTRYTPLTDVEVAKLESIGMVWNVLENKQKNIELCILNNIDYKKYPNLINNFSFDQLKRKIAFLNEQNFISLDEETYYELLGLSYQKLLERMKSIMKSQTR